MTTGSKHPKEPTPRKKKGKPKSIEIPLPIVPNDEPTMEDEMSELFNEDKVKHKHGRTEPERD